MFDDLHDPDPPKPGLDTLARVSSRAKSIRRRRSMTVAASSFAVVALVVAVVVLPNIGDDRDRITTVDDSVVPTPSSVVVDTTIGTTIDSTPSTSDVVRLDADRATVERVHDGATTAGVPGRWIGSRRAGHLEPRRRHVIGAVGLGRDHSSHSRSRRGRAVRRRSRERGAG